MRLPNVERGDSVGSKLLFGLIRVVSGHRAPDVVRTLKYRAAFFGGLHSAHTHEVMRGDSEWSVAHREVFAAFVSHRNQCRF